MPMSFGLPFELALKKTPFCIEFLRLRRAYAVAVIYLAYGGSFRYFSSYCNLGLTALISQAPQEWYSVAHTALMCVSGLHLPQHEELWLSETV